jgi:hypothetical protein
MFQFESACDDTRLAYESWLEKHSTEMLVARYKHVNCMEWFLKYEAMDLGVPVK